MVCACNTGAARPLFRDDYLYIGYHKIHTNALNWNNARKVRLKEGGHLAVVNSITEATILMDMYSKAGPMKGAALQDHKFYSVCTICSRRDYQLENSGYNMWAPTQPDNGLGSGQDCGSRDGTFDDIDCESPYGSVCEIAEIRLH
ncbi:hemolymph lipopolysaccharide-binding protein-like [Andrena cerasifolii]|uniref:hemolymph lipopolysaccharide-binding protein-like n=1 Tax=Andrena cerasifolii TaxID=2819439 RepID=UPI004037B77B